MGRRENTWDSYSSKLRRWIDFCTVIYPSSGHTPLCPCPASTASILAYLGYLQDEDRVHHASLQPYLSAINSLHSDLGFPKPAAGPLVQLARKGFGEVEGELDPDRKQREALPADIALQIFELGMRARSIDLLRKCVCLCTHFAFFARGDTGVQALRMDVTLDARGLHWRERTKTLSRWKLATLSIPWPTDDRACLHQLMLRWLKATMHLPRDDVLWRLPDERLPRPWPASVISDWLADVLAVLDITPPPGVLWSMHSMRSGGATAALSIGADVLTIARWGIWASISSVQLYADPLVQPSSAAAFFFGHLLKDTSFLTRSSAHTAEVAW
jgi:hypothetical protein